MRLSKITSAVLFTVGITSCSGGSNALLNPPAQQGPIQENSQTHTAPVLTNGVRPDTNPAHLTVAGPVVALFSGGFTIKTGSSCPGGGSLHIYTSSSTKFNGPKPAVGKNATVYGQGSCGSAVAALTVTTGMTVKGPIVALFSKGFIVKTGSSCPGGGDLNIDTSSSTTFSGPTLAAGETATVEGQGSCTTHVVASTVATSHSGNLTVAGPILGLFSGGFNVKTGSSCPGGGELDIYTNSSTKITGPNPASGENATVSGQGTCTTHITASTITTSSGAKTQPAQTHLLTADYLGDPDGTTSIAWSAAAPYLTWAQTGTSSADAIQAAGIKTEVYADPNDTSNDADPFYTSNAATFAQTCGGSRLTYQYDGRTFYVMNIGNAALQALFANYVSWLESQAHFNAVFEDQAGPLSGPTYPCNYSNSTWTDYGIDLNNASPLPVMIGGLEDLYNDGPSLAIGLLSSGNTIGGNYEHCYSDNSTAKMHDWVWQAMEKSELEVVQKGKLFRCQLRNSNNASQNTDARIYALASFLLTYNPKTSVLWEEFSTPSRLHVMPESGLVALSPTTTSPSSLGDLQTSGGAYARQYNQCYYRGTSIGACAVVVNPSSTSSVRFPYTQYHHTLVIDGSGVLDGGTIYTDGSAPPATLPKEEAAVVFP